MDISVKVQSTYALKDIKNKITKKKYIEKKIKEKILNRRVDNVNF